MNVPRMPEQRARLLMDVVGFVWLLSPLITTVAGFPGQGGPPVSPLIVTPMVAAVAAVHLRHSHAASRGLRPAGWRWTFLALILLTYLPLPWWSWTWVVVQGYLCASAGMLLRTRNAVAITVATIGVSTAGAWMSSAAAGVNAPLTTYYWLQVMLLAAVSLYGSVRLVHVVSELRVTRAGLAEAAVGRERLRLSRDLHDLLGQSLSAVSLKGDLALALLGRDPAAAGAEIKSLTGVAREALRDVRAVTRDEHSMALSNEIDGAAALLSAAGIETRIDVDEPRPGAAVERLLAWSVREGVTNILRHSEARSCSISVGRGTGSIRLELVNDGAGRSSGPPGTGLDGLAQRAQTLAGTVTASRTGDQFRLVIDVPEETP